MTRPDETQVEQAEPVVGEPATEPAEPAGDEEASAPRGAETSFDDAEAAPASTAAPGPPPTGTGNVEQDLEELVTKARERDEYLALAQRTQADFENYRRRMARENAAAGDRGVAKVARELLPAIDHLELALKSVPEDTGGDVVKGFAMVRDELAGALSRVGIEAIVPQGEAFDPTEHEAMAQAPVEGADPGTVVEVYQRGYRLGGTVLRPARVVVAQ